MEVFNGNKFHELLRYVDFFAEGNKPPFFKKKNDKAEKPVKDSEKKTKKNNPFFPKDKRGAKKPEDKKVSGKGKGKIPPGLASYLAKKKGGKNDSKNKD